ncbi:MAG: hypothetical protein IPL09_07655 [Bacteroidetes bacterium]|nr:hypothetical protein [Bacteroidota bacterium]
MFFETENLEDFFLSDIFKKNHQPSENFSLIEYFHNKAAKVETQDWNQKLKSIPFIYARGKKLKSPQSVCFPSIDFETEFGEGVTVIHGEVYPKIETNSKIKSWLEFLGVKEPSDESYLENEIIGNIENCIDKNNYLKITRYIFNQHKKGLLSELHYDQLKELRILTTKKEFKTAKECYLSDFYEPSFRLEKIIETVAFVSDSYKLPADLKSEWKTFFLYIGTKEKISWENSKIKDISNRPDAAYFQIFKNDLQENYWKYSNGGWQFNLDYFTINRLSFQDIIVSDYEKSYVFWEYVIKNCEPYNSDSIDYAEGYTGLYRNFWFRHKQESYFKWSINNLPIFPSTKKKCFKANELYINEKEITEIAGNFLPVFDYDEALPKEWRNILPFKKSLELNDYIEILERIAKQKKKKEDDDTSKLIGKKKIALIYGKLASSISNFSKDEKQDISNWAKTNKILSQNDEFIKSTDLFWLKGTTSNFGSELELAFLPDELLDDENIEELLSLLELLLFPSSS